MIPSYTSQLHAGVGLVDETFLLLELWQPGMSGSDVAELVLQSGRLPMMSARRIRNLVAECFVPRYVQHDGLIASRLKKLKDIVSYNEMEQLLFIYTCRVHTILRDFVADVYWNAYISGRTSLSNEDAQQFVVRANQEGKTSTPWSEGTVVRVARYLTASCADFGLLERGTKRERKILPYRIDPHVAVVLTYDLHFAHLGDNAIVNHQDWALFGLEPLDVIEELKRLSLRGDFIVQHAGGMVHIGWKWKTMDEVINAIAQ